MTALLILIPVSIGMGLVGLGAFIWAIRHQQFDDLEGNAWRVIELSQTTNKEGMPDERLATHVENREPAERL